MPLRFNMQVRQKHPEKVFSTLYSSFGEPLPATNLIASLCMSELDFEDNLLKIEFSFNIEYLLSAAFWLQNQPEKQLTNHEEKLNQRKV